MLTDSTSSTAMFITARQLFLTKYENSRTSVPTITAQLRLFLIAWVPQNMRSSSVCINIW